MNICALWEMFQDKIDLIKQSHQIIAASGQQFPTFWQEMHQQSNHFSPLSPPIDSELLEVLQNDPTEDIAKPSLQKLFFLILNIIWVI